jgi:hypothetical protein
MKSLNKTAMKSYCLLFITFVLVLNSTAQPPGVKLNIIGGIQNQSLKSKIESNTNHLLSAINTAFINGQSKLVIDDKIITHETLTILQDMWDEIHFYCANANISENLLTSAHSYQIRNIPIVLSNDAQTAVICYDRHDGRISDFYFGLEIQHYNSVMQSEKVVDQARREIILNFIEDFRTAYIRKDIDFIDRVFSEHALIIVGRVLQKANVKQEHSPDGLTKEEHEFIVLTKSKYIERLSRNFSQNSHLILQFNNIEVNQHRKHPNFYGVLLEQYWQWTNESGERGYGDTGYLFLLMQFRDDDDPLIWVRTWQDIKSVEEDNVFGFHNFVIRQGVVK